MDGLSNILPGVVGDGGNDDLLGELNNDAQDTSSTSAFLQPADAEAAHADTQDVAESKHVRRTLARLKRRRKLEVGFEMLDVGLFGVFEMFDILGVFGVVL